MRTSITSVTPFSAHSAISPVADEHALAVGDVDGVGADTLAELAPGLRTSRRTRRPAWGNSKFSPKASATI
jgi:hypothetical protein